MSLFKGNTPTQAADDSQEVVNDFTRRAPFCSYRPVPYRFYDPLVNLKDDLDGYLERLFQGEIDDANGDVLDCLIFDVVRQAVEDLKKQRVNHQDAIISFGIRAESDRAAFEDQLARLRTDLEETRSEQTFVSGLLKRGEYKEVSENA